MLGEPPPRRLPPELLDRIATSAGVAAIWKPGPSDRSPSASALRRPHDLRVLPRRRLLPQPGGFEGIRIYVGSAAPAPSSRASMALTAFSNALSKRRLPMVPSTTPSARPLKFLPSRTTT
jgi:hypothetical protein